MDEMQNKMPETKAWYYNWQYWLVVLLAVAIVWVLLVGQNSSTNLKPAALQNLPKRPVKIFIQPQTDTVKVGEMFAADIVLDTANGPIDGVDIYALHYNSGILKVIDDVPNQKGAEIKPGAIMPYNTANIVDESTGTIKFSQVVAGGTNFRGQGILATIHFKALKPGTATLKFDFTLGSTTDTNAAYQGLDRLGAVAGAEYTVIAK